MYKQKIFIADDDPTKEPQLLELCTFGDLAQTLAALAKQENIHTFHLFGDIKFIHDIGDELETIFKLEYSAQNIVVNYN